MLRTETPPVETDQLLEEIEQACVIVREDSSPVLRTEITYESELSKALNANIFFASELHQPIVAYKIRGAYNFIRSLPPEELKAGIVTASAGNHAQGIALVCALMGVRNHVFMPETTPRVKVDRVNELGGDNTQITLAGATFDECQGIADRYCEGIDAVFAHPFDDIKVIAGQGTWGTEINETIYGIDLVFCPVGGMGLLAGVGTAIRSCNPDVQIVGVEPCGARSLQAALDNGHPKSLQGEIDTVIDGASVSKVGETPFRLARHLVSKVVDVSNTEAATATTQLWERDKPLRAELAGALSVAALNKHSRLARGKNVVCLITGGNLSSERFDDEVKQMAV